MEALQDAAEWLVSLGPLVWLPLAAVAAAAVYWFFKPLMDARRADDHPSEAYFPTPDVKAASKALFPRLIEDGTIDLSLIVPAYNEEDRLPDMMGEMIEYLGTLSKSDAKVTWEIIIVDDGSSDGTSAVALKYVRDLGSNTVRLLRLHSNCGKGGAVRKGMMRARGKFLLMVDADGATTASDLEKLMNAVAPCKPGDMRVAVGSRAHQQDEAVAQRAWYRNVLMHGFHALVAVLAGGHGIRDTQCGFKLFSREAALRLFSSLHIDRWAFDVELMYLAVLLDIPVVEIPVNWREIDGSKVDLFSSTFQMARDILMIRIAYMCRIWRPKLTPADEVASAVFQEGKKAR